MSANTDPAPSRHLKLEDNGDETFTLLEGVTWIDLETGTVITVPKGFQTDFASVPRIFWNIIPPYGRHGFAAVIHDYLYSLRGALTSGRTLSRADCDRIFIDAMRASGVRVTRRGVMWFAVRLFGWLPW